MGTARARRPRPPRRLRVFLVSAEQRLRRHVALAARRNAMEVCGVASDPLEAVARVLAEQPDLCLIDTAIEGDVMGAMQHIAAAVPAITVAAVSGDMAHQRFVAAVRAGAWGYLPRDATVEDLAVALGELAAGRPVVPRQLTAALVAELRSL